jgi:hypothetical protein
MCSRNTPSPQGYEMLFQGMKHVFSSKTVVFHTFMLQPLSNLFSAGSFSEEEVRTPRTCRLPPHSPLIQILKSFPAPCCYEIPPFLMLLDRDTRRSPRTQVSAVIARRSVHCSLLRIHKPRSPFLLCPARALIPLRPFLNPSLT